MASQHFSGLPSSRPAISEPVRPTSEQGDSLPVTPGAEVFFATAAASAPWPAAPTGSRPRVSLCLIVKDEEANLPACLGSAADLVDEIIVVDTGSTDRTREVAARYGARIFDFPWCDDFSAARNESLRHAASRWIFWLDADDSLDPANRERLRVLLAGLRDENAAYLLRWLCLPDPATGASLAVDQVRLFRNHPELRWRYRVHEQILPAVRRLGNEVRRSEVVIHHRGYLDAGARARKAERNRRLLEMEYAEHPGDPFVLFNLGTLEAQAGRPAAAAELLRRSLELSGPQDSIAPRLHALLAVCQARLGQGDKALATCRAGRGRFPRHAGLLLQEGLLLLGRDDCRGAEACFQAALQAPGEAVDLLDADPDRSRARHHLAAVLLRQGRPAEAAEHWRAVVALRPQFLPAWLGLGEALVARGEWAAFQGVLGELQTRFPGRPEANLLRARARIARGDFPGARRALEGILAREPRSVTARLLLAETLLRQGRDREAGRHLRVVVKQEPQNPEARKLLQFLGGRQTLMQRKMGDNW